MNSKKIQKLHLLKTENMQFFPVSQSKSGPDPDPKFIKRFTVRIQSKSEDVHCGPDPVHGRSQG